MTGETEQPTWQDAQGVAYSFWWRSEQQIAEEWQRIANSLKRTYSGVDR